MRFLPLFSLLLTLAACNSQPKTTVTSSADPADRASVTEDMPDFRYDPPTKEGMVETVEHDTEYWKELLTPEEFNVLREEGTERSFSSPLNDEKRAGVFACRACGLPLFASDTKFKSGTGWPSFFQPINEAYVKEDVDTRYGMRRVEVSCARCDGHQGHIFPDGPEPTGLRYCINGVALNFVPAGEVGIKLKE